MSIIFSLINVIAKKAIDKDREREEKGRLPPVELSLNYKKKLKHVAQEKMKLYPFMSYNTEEMSSFFKEISEL